ncbi:17133_t:CDS:2, partial [Acaulospora morrowiae]
MTSHNTTGRTSGNRRLSASFRYVDGRRFHNVKGSSYPLPNDELEVIRMDAQHELMRGVWDGDFVSPIKDDLIAGGLHVLDVGCGSGTWLLQLARDYPLNHYTGIDMSPVFPKNIELPNVKFIQANVLQRMPFDANSFDFVHIRFLNTAFTERQWEETVIPDLTRVTKPKGWLELCEFDIDGQSFGPASRRMVSALTSYLGSKGINGLISEEILEFLESMETFEVIRTEEKFSGLGKWAGHLGDLAIKSFIAAFRGMKELPGWMGIEEEEYNEMVDKYAQEVENRGAKGIRSNTSFWRLMRPQRLGWPCSPGSPDDGRATAEVDIREAEILLICNEDFRLAASIVAILRDKGARSRDVGNLKTTSSGASLVRNFSKKIPSFPSIDSLIHSSSPLSSDATIVISMFYNNFDKQEMLLNACIRQNVELFLGWDAGMELKQFDGIWREP